MKIGIDIRTLMEKEYSGVSEYTLNLVTEILAQDKEDEYKLFYNSYKDISARMPKFVGDNVEILKLGYPNKLFNNVLQKILAWPKLDKFLDADLFFMPNLGFTALSKRSKKVITVHDLSFLRYPNFFSGKRRAWHNLVNIKKKLNQFDKIIAVSENTKRDIIELCQIPEEKIKVIYSGIDRRYKRIESIYSEADFDSIKKKYGLPDKFILFLGTIEPRKNIDGLIRAYNLLRDRKEGVRDLKLVLAGAKGWKYDQVFSEYEKSPYKADIKFINYVDREDKVYIYNLAKVFVFPSFYEGFGFPPLEAMSCGIPVVSSSSSSLGEVIGQAGILVDPNNVSEIAEAMFKAISDDSLRKRLNISAQENVKKFDWEKCAREYVSSFQALKNN